MVVKKGTDRLKIRIQSFTLLCIKSIAHFSYRKMILGMRTFFLSLDRGENHEPNLSVTMTAERIKFLH